MKNFLCNQCHSVVEVSTHGDYRSKFCGKSCAAKYSNSHRAPRKGPKKICLGCNKECTNANAAKYCSEICSGSHRSLEIVRKWLSGEEDGSQKNGGLRGVLRRHLIKEANYSCSKCGWGEINLTTKLSPLEIDHIDGDAFNNQPSNLMVLCPNCHSLTSTYKSLNKSTRLNRPTKI